MYIRQWWVSALFCLLFCLQGCDLSAKRKNPVESVKANTLEFVSKELFSGDSAKNDLLSIMIARDELWVGTNSGLYTFSISSLTQTNQYLDGQTVVDLGVSQSNTIYAVTTQKGLYALPTTDSEFFHTGSVKVRNILVPEKADVVYCATASGIDVFSGGKFRNIRIKSDNEYASRANDITALVQDATGVIWIGTNFGVYRMSSENSFEFFFGDYQIVQGDSIVNRQGNSALGGNLIYHMYSSADESLNFATNGGLTQLKKASAYRDKSQWMSLQGDHTISQMENGKIVEVARKGNTPLPTNFIQNSLQAAGLLFVGTENGLAVQQEGKWTLFSLDNQLAGDNIRDMTLHETVDETRIYIATSGGLSLMRRPKTAAQPESSQNKTGN